MNERFISTMLDIEKNEENDSDDDEDDVVDYELTETDILDIQNNIYESMDEYMESEIIHMASPDFHKKFIKDISYYFYDYWLDAKLCDEDDLSDLEDMIEELSTIYFDISNIPPRSIPYGSVLEPVTKNVDALRRQIDSLKSIPQPKQKTPEWHQFRYNLITASNLWKALDSTAQQNSLIFEKCKPLDMSRTDSGFCNPESTLHWGVRYEPLTVMVYENMYQTKVDDFGCIPHPKYNFIGASPDGINVDEANAEKFGRMIEIKNIFNREITAIPKQEYWVQCQIQMETCDLDECDFVETRFKEYESEELFYQDTQHEYKGVILYFVQRPNRYDFDISQSVPFNNSPIYKYMPLDIPLDKENIDHWINSTKEENKIEFVLFKPLFWYMDEFSCVLIKRNPLWFQSALPKITDTWNIILKERVDGYHHRAPKKKISANKTEVVVENETNTTHYIKNLPLTNNICLIKLEPEPESI